VSGIESGWITSEWHKSDDRFEWQVTVPPNTTATLYLPATDAAQVTESGRMLEKAKNVRVRGVEEGRLVVQIESGTYHFLSDTRR